MPHQRWHAVKHRIQRYEYRHGRIEKESIEGVGNWMWAPDVEEALRQVEQDALTAAREAVSALLLAQVLPASHDMIRVLSTLDELQRSGIKGK